MIKRNYHWLILCIRYLKAEKNSIDSLKNSIMGLYHPKQKEHLISLFNKKISEKPFSQQFEPIDKTKST